MFVDRGSKNGFPFFIPALSNFVLVLAGIWMSLPDFATSVEKNRMAKEALERSASCSASSGLNTKQAERTTPEQSSQELFQEVKSGLDKTDVESEKPTRCWTK